MTNEVNQDAEESRAIEKTAIEQAESTTEQAPAQDVDTNTEAAESQPDDAPTSEDNTPGEAAVSAEGEASTDQEAASEDSPAASEDNSAEEAAVSTESEAPTDQEAAGEDSPAVAAEETSDPEPAPAAEVETPPVSEPVSEQSSTDASAAKTDVAEPPSVPTRPQYRTITVPKPIRFEPEPAATPAAPVAPATKPAAAKAAEPAEETQGGDIDFGAILEQFEQEQIVFHAGELVEGKIVGITDRGILVDFGYKSEGYVPVEEFTGPGGEMLAVVGEDVEVIIRNISGDGAPQLSRIDALGRKVWDEIEASFNAEEPITGRVVDKTKGGLRIDINGVEAFLPGSQIDSRPARGLDTYIGQDIEAQVIKFSRRRNNIVLSRKVITDKIVGAQKAETMSKIEIGYIVDGTIKNLTEYGAFVDIGGIDGLLHVTDMSWGRIHHPGDLFKVAEHIQIKVLKLDREREKISLGYKQLLPDPWSTVVEVYPVNTKIKGTVSSVTEYGVFVELEPGVEGLVHVSEISWARRAQSPKRLFQKNQEVEVQVLGVDTVEKRISLGMKQFQENPWDMVDIKYPVGAKVQGRVRNLTEFGAFVELEEGIDGLVHVSDITWAKKIKHPKDVLKKDQEVEAIVTSIDKRGQRLSLSMKDLTPSAWEGFVATHRPGDVVRGKVSRFTNFGVFVELGEGLEGLCHISELSDERLDRPESVAELGQEMDFKILRIEPADQKIGLSHRAVGKDEAPAAARGGGGGGGDSKMYSTEAKGGMASLGELAKLRMGGEEAPPPAEEDPEEKKRAKAAAKKAKAEEFAAREAEAEKATETPVAETPAEEPAPEAPAEEAPADAAVAEAEESADEPAAETAVEEAPQTAEEPAAEAAEEKPVEESAEPEAAAETAAPKQEEATDKPIEPEGAVAADEPVVESAETADAETPEAKAEETAVEEVTTEAEEATTTDEPVVESAETADTEAPEDKAEETAVEKVTTEAEEATATDEPVAESQETADAEAPKDKETAVEEVTEAEVATTTDEPIVESEQTVDAETSEAKAEETASDKAETSVKEVTEGETAADKTPAEESEKKSA